MSTNYVLPQALIFQEFQLQPTALLLQPFLLQGVPAGFPVRRSQIRKFRQRHLHELLPFSVCQHAAQRAGGDLVPGAMLPQQGAEDLSGGQPVEVLLRGPGQALAAGPGIGQQQV